MPVYQTREISDTIRLGVWKISETTDELLQEFIHIGFDRTGIFRSPNRLRVKQWLATRLLLSRFFSDAEITYDNLGKPGLDNGWFISISHSEDLVAIILNKNTHCGIDIERYSSKLEVIKHKFLNESDLKSVTLADHLTLYWGAKEALYKVYGKKQVLFIEHLFIEDFCADRAGFRGRIHSGDLQAELPMAWEKIDNHILAYTC